MDWSVNAKCGIILRVKVKDKDELQVPNSRKDDQISLRGQDQSHDKDLTP
jgi:hypothetical protein